MKKFGEYFVTIGLEIHVALDTKEKLFSATKNTFDVEQFSLFDAGIPGMLPVLSQEPIEMAIAFGIATNAQIQKHSMFERKHYFYPDLPLGYQITQQHQPIIIGGTVKIKDDEGQDKYVVIEHAHLECDAAKSLHDMHQYHTAIDISRCASALLEIVSTPCMHSPEEAKEYVKAVHSLVTFMGICDGKLEEGSFRVDASISLSKTEKLGTRVEIKNISSFSFLQSALEYEMERQKEMLDKEQEIVMETRLFNEKDMETYSMRKKETVDEYRYMPDPDIPLLIFDDEFVAMSQKKYITHYFDLKEKLKKVIHDVKVIMKDEEIDALLSSPFKDIWIKVIEDDSLQMERMIKMLAYWLPDSMKKVIPIRKVELEQMRVLLHSSFQAKECKETIEKWLTSSLSIAECFPVAIDDDLMKEKIKEVLIQYQKQAQQYKDGEEKMFQFIMGKVMSIMKGSASASDVRNSLIEILKIK